MFVIFFFFKQKTAYEMRISDWSSDVCSSDLERQHHAPAALQCLLRLQCDEQCRGRALRRHQAAPGLPLRAPAATGRPGPVGRLTAMQTGRGEDMTGLGLPKIGGTSMSACETGVDAIVTGERAGRGPRSEDRRVGQRGGRT